MKEKELELSRGLNVIEGENESGKSTLCMFIKFMFYGLSGRGCDGDMSERQKYVPWDTGRAAGNLTIVTGKGEFRISRELSLFDEGQHRERTEVIDLYSGERVFKGKVPGLCILGIDEQMFVNTVFIRQMGGVSIDGTGMAEAIENILMAGDENLSVRKAVDRLEKSRRALMPKKGTGGRIQMLMQEKARLEARLEEAKQSSSALIAYENEAAKLSALIEKRTAEKNKYDELCRAYKKIEAGRRLEAALKVRERTEELQEKLSLLEEYGDIPGQTGRINALFARLSGIESRQKGLRRSLGDAPDEADSMSGEEILNARRSVTRARKDKEKRGTFAILLSVMLALGAGVAAVGYFLRGSVGQSVMIASLCAAGVLVLVGVVMAVLCAVSSASLLKVLKEWGVRNVQGLEREVEKKIDRAHAYTRASEEREKRLLEIQGCEEDRQSIIASLRGACSAFVQNTDEYTDTDILVSQAIEAASSVAKEKEETGAALAMARGELKGYSDVLGYDGGEAVRLAYEEISETEAGKAALEFTTKDAAMAISKKNFAESALPGLISQKGEVDSGIARTKATAGDTSVLAAQLDGAERELAAMERRLAGIEAATAALISASEAMRASLMPRVIGEASELMGRFTDGKYSALSADRSFALGFSVDGIKREISNMSAGTQDAAYISFRCALAREIFAGDVPPFVCDESFARIDENRLFGILSALNESGFQSLVFTCRHLEGDMARRLEGAVSTEL
ncbi:MAG: AAA family ATPase [Clostridia bacterium]|nr:AAA family ATPase [Clostridia bacterium]